jgi:hypothetical protein
MGEYTEAFIGIDAAKARNAVAVAEGGRGGEVRYLGEVDASEQGMRRVVARIAAKYDRVHFCYEAGPTGYGLHRLAGCRSSSSPTRRTRSSCRRRSRPSAWPRSASSGSRS